MTAAESDLVPAIRFVGRDVVGGQSGLVLATLGDDGCWRTPEGFTTAGLDLPAMQLHAVVSEEARRARNREIDAVWLEEALPVVYELAKTTTEFTADEVWERLPTKPREPRLVGSLMRLARTRGYVTPTSRDRPSTRPRTHRAPIRIWRSCIRDAPSSLFDVPVEQSTARAA